MSSQHPLHYQWCLTPHLKCIAERADDDNHDDDDEGDGCDDNHHEDDKDDDSHDNYPRSILAFPKLAMTVMITIIVASSALLMLQNQRS